MEEIKEEIKNEEINKEEHHNNAKKIIESLDIDFSKQRWPYLIKFFILLLVLTFLRAISTYVFILPNAFAPGGFSGISSILYNAVKLTGHEDLAKTVFDAGLTTFIMNIPLFILAFFKLQKRFAYNTFIVVGFYSLFMAIFSLVDFPQYTALNADGTRDTGIQLIAAIFGGVGCGISFGFMIRHNMCLGGTDIIGKLIYQKNPSTGVQWWIFACDCAIALSAGALGFIGLDYKNSTSTEILTAILSPILFSFISLFIQSEASDLVSSGMHASIVFNIITDHPNRISEAITTKLHRGVTATKATGCYTGEEHTLLVVVISKKQVNIVKQIVEAGDPKAFTYITKAKEVNGQGFKRFQD